MRTFGCVLAIFGGILCIISLLLFGRSILRATEAEAVQTIPIHVGQPLRTQTLHVNTLRYCMIAIRATVQSQRTRKLRDESDRISLVYSFPFHYTVYDANNRIIAAQKTEFSDRDGNVHTTTTHNLTEAGGTLEITSDYDKFRVNPPGEIRIEAQIEPDTTSHATAEGPELLIYDNVSQHTKPVAIGIFLITIGGPSAFVGLVLFIVGSLRKAEKSPPQTS